MESLTLESYAKVNLGLGILGKRGNDYHDIETVLQSVSLSDSVEVELKGEDVAVCCQKLEVPKGRLNLAHRAAEDFIHRSEQNLGARITIDKRIPLGSGLGGASSNAAAVLLGLNSLTGGAVSPEILFSIGRELGSDVPFFLRGGTALATGRGEILDFSLPTPPIWFVLVYPNFPISTEWAYSRIRASPTPSGEPEENRTREGGARFSLTEYAFSANMMVKAIRDGAISDIVSNLRNSFEEVVFERYPELRRLKEELVSLGVLGASLSGSGSSLFGICEGKNRAQRISRSLAGTGYWVRVVKALSREEVL